jgi:hypothetical protein
VFCWRALQVLLDELDMQDIRKAALPAAWSGLSAGQGSGGGSKAGVRVATIDNYQASFCDKSNDNMGCMFDSEAENRLCYAMKPDHAGHHWNSSRTSSGWFRRHQRWHGCTIRLSIMQV